MLTIFSIPKPFLGHITVIQRNAIQSWMRLHPECEIILCADDHGTKETAAEFKIKYIPDVARNDYGTPLVNSAFEQAERIARHSLLCYVNADIVLMKNFISAVRSITFQKFLMVGQRWDVNVSEPINFGIDDWEDRLKKQVAEDGSLQPPNGIDYFVFPHETVGRLPPFAVGRPGWDNWLIYQARARRIPVIDATKVATAIHQNHDYSHVKQAWDNSWEGPEAQRNREIVGGREYIFTIRDATHSFGHTSSASSSGAYCLRKRLGTLPVPILKAKKTINYWVKGGIRLLKRQLLSNA